MPGRCRAGAEPTRARAARTLWRAWESELWLSLVLVQMWQGGAQSPVQMWQGGAQSPAQMGQACARCDMQVFE